MLRRRRKRSGMSQESLAHAAGLHPTYISLLERGLRAPSLPTIEVLAKALGTTCARMVGDAEKR